MSARVEAKGLTIALERDLRDEELEALINAIRQLRGVEDVTVVKPEPLDYFERKRVRAELGTALHNAINRVLNPDDST